MDRKGEPASAPTWFEDGRNIAEHSVITRTLAEVLNVDIGILGFKDSISRANTEQLPYET